MAAVVQAITTPIPVLTKQDPIITPRTGATITPISVLRNGTLVGYKSTDRTLHLSRDDGATYTPSGASIATGSAFLVKETGDGEVLIVGSGGTKIYKSKGWGTSTVTTEVVLSSPAGTTSTYFSDRYGGLTTGKNFALAVEYGLHTSDVAASEIEKAATRAYLSRDNGATWELIFDLKATPVEGSVRSSGNPSASHLHGGAVDGYWDRIWIAFGDGGIGQGAWSGIIYMDLEDTTKTWKSLPGTLVQGNMWQCVGIMVAEKGVFFGNDGTPAGMHKILRTGYRQHPPISEAIQFGGATGSTIISVAGGTRYGQPVLFAGHTGVSSTSAGTIYVSGDGGQTWQTLWSDPNPISGGANFGGLRKVLGPTNTGGMVAETSNALPNSGGSYFKFAKPTFATE